MNAKTTLLILSLFHLFLGSQIQAQFYSGSEISYQHLAGYSYKVRVVFYTNCQGSGSPNNITISCSSSSNPNNNFTITAYKTSMNGTEVTPVCTYQSTECTNGSLYGVSAFIYETAATTFIPAPDWQISYKCNCGSCFTNVVPNSGGYTVSAFLNNQLVTGNNSPKFLDYTTPVIQKNRIQYFSNLANENDGDSLVYEIAPAYCDLNYPCSYLSPYTYSHFLNGICELNPQNGEMKLLTTNSIVSSTYSIRVKEYRKVNGQYQLVGYSTRTSDLIVYSSNNSIPLLSGMDTLLTNTYNTNDTLFSNDYYLGTNIQFNINGLDTNSVSGNPEPYSIHWNNGIQGATFQTFYNNSDSAYAQFSWTPTPDDTNNRQHCFSVTIQDSACPYNGIQSRAFCLKIKAPKLILNPDTSICRGDSIQLYIKNLIPTYANIASYHWNTGDTMASIWVKPVSTTTYKLTATDLTNFSFSDSVIIEVKGSKVDLGSDTIHKYSHTLVLDAGPGFISYLWSNYTQNQTIILDSNIYNLADTIKIYVDVTDSLSCKSSDTITVIIENDLSITKNFNEIRLGIFPNPTEEKFNIIVEGYIGKALIEIVNQEGTKLYLEEINIGQGFVKQIHFKQSSGAYFINMITPKGTYGNKLIIQ